MKYTIRALTRRTEDTWEASFYTKDPVTGKRTPHYFTINAKTEKQAKKLRDELRFELEKGPTVHVSTETVSEMLVKYIEYKAASGTVENSTIRDYHCSRRFLERYIGDVLVCKLTVDGVNEMMAEALRDGYKPKTVCKPFRLLKQTLKHCVMLGLLDRNVCDFCQPPKRTHEEINALSKAERERLLSLSRLAQPARLAIAIELAVTTGMRRGEICALRWSDINSDGTITVRRALGNGVGGYYVKPPKSNRERTIPLSKRTQSLLKAVREGHESDYHILGVKMPDAYICGTCEKDSKPYNPSLLTKEFSTFAKMNGFDCTFHDLRHSFATMMISKNVDIRTVASYLGHASPSMTLDVYADVDPDAKKAAVDKIDEEYNDVLAKSLTELIASEMMSQDGVFTPLPDVSVPPQSKDQSPADHAMALLMSLDVKSADPSMLKMLVELAQGRPVA